MAEDKIYDQYELRPLADVVPYDIPSTRERFLKLYTALIYDSMEAYGMPGRSMESGVYPLTTDMKVAGPAFTVRRQTTPNTDPFTHNIRLGLMKSMCDGCILLSDVQGNKNCGQFGEITATAMRAAGCAGQRAAT